MHYHFLSIYVLISFVISVLLSIGLSLSLLSIEFVLTYGLLPQALTILPLSRFWSIVYFVMLLSIGFDTMILMYSSFVAGMKEFFELSDKNMRILNILITIILMLIAQTMTSNCGVYVLLMLIHGALSWNVLLGILLISLSIRLYGEYLTFVDENIHISQNFLQVQNVCVMILR